jgi:predicted SAM-dependent methyltransferase
MKKQIRGILNRSAVCQRIYDGYVKAKRGILRTNHRLANSYFSANEIPKLHLGSNWLCKDGWLNADLDAFPGVYQMDATKRFPFRDAQFQFVFTEHMIEHLPYASGKLMLGECFRTMRPGGRIRIVTPNLAVLVGLYDPSRSKLATSYIEHMNGTFATHAPRHSASFVINTFFREWGHQFIYDDESLSALMREVGFEDIRRQELGMSEHAEFRSLENQERYPEGLLAFESIAFEGTKCG